MNKEDVRFVGQPTSYCNVCRKYKAYGIGFFDPVTLEPLPEPQRFQCAYTDECRHVVKLTRHAMKEALKEGLLG